MPSHESPQQGSDKRNARSPKLDIPLLERAAVSPNEFAALFGKQTVWGYRMIYAGKVKVIPNIGRIMIPIAEVKRLMAVAETYTGKPKSKVGNARAPFTPVAEPIRRNE